MLTAPFTANTSRTTKYIASTYRTLNVMSQEVAHMSNEVKYSRFTETGEVRRVQNASRCDSFSERGCRAEVLVQLAARKMV